jgi:hypothetical protein
LESGLGDPSLAILLAIAHVLEVTLNALVVQKKINLPINTIPYQLG